MPTALDLVTRSMRVGRFIGKGETLDSDEADDGLEALNSMLDNFQLERLYVYRVREEQFTWTGGNQSRTVGSGGSFSTDRPTRVDDSSYFRSGNIDYPIDLIDSDAWSLIPDKSTTSTIPEKLYPEYGTSLVTLYAYPTPSAAITFLLRTWQKLQNFAALATAMDLPPGYEDLIVFNLCERFGTEFGKDVPERVLKLAQETKKSVKRVNNVTPIMAPETGQFSRQAFNWRTG